MSAQEAEKRDVLQKLEIIGRALPEIKRLARKGNIVPVPQKRAYVIDGLIEGIFEVSVKEVTVSFRLCRYDLLDRKPRSRFKQFFTDLLKTLHA